MISPDLRRALSFIVPYWRRLALVLALSVLSTALTLFHTGRAQAERRFGVDRMVTDYLGVYDRLVGRA